MNCNNICNVELDVIGAPFQHGQRKPGVEKAPRNLRESGLIRLLQHQNFGLRVTDKGDVDFEEFDEDSVYCNVRNPRSVGDANRKISAAVKESIGGGRRCLVVGGDHSVAVGSIDGHAASVDEDLAVIWVDAHGDINPPAASVSGNAHGMPVAFLLEELRHTIPNDLPGFDWLQPCLEARDIAYIGLRDVDDAERAIFDELNVTTFYMEDVERLGIAEVVRKAVEAVSPNLSRPIHLSFDIDALDSAVAPSTGTAVSGGLSLEDGIYITRTLASTGRLEVMDLVEVNVELGSETDQQLTLTAANAVVAAWFDPDPVSSF